MPEEEEFARPKVSQSSAAGLFERIWTVCRGAEDVWGKDAQAAKVMEELGELLGELGKARGNRSTKQMVTEEAVDAIMMSEGAATLVGATPEQIMLALEGKLRRTEERVRAARDPEVVHDD